jgi:hypothetical protein
MMHQICGERSTTHPDLVRHNTISKDGWHSLSMGDTHVFVVTMDEIGAMVPTVFGSHELIKTLT